MVDTITVEDSGTTIELIEVGIQGPPGPTGAEGPGFANRMGNVSIGTPTNTTITLIAYSPYAFPITGLFGLKTASGTCKITLQINGTSLPEVTGLAVASTAQFVPVSATVAIGDRLTMTISDVNEANGLEFTSA